MSTPLLALVLGVGAIAIVGVGVALFALVGKRLSEDPAMTEFNERVAAAADDRIPEDGEPHDREPGS